MERVPGRSQIAGLPFARTDGGNCPRGGRRGTSFPVRAVAVQSCDAGGAHASESDGGRKNDADGAGGARSGNQSRYEGGAIARAADQESTSIYSFRLEAEKRVRTRSSICAIGARAY